MRSTGAATSYTATATNLSANYGAGGTIVVTAAACGGTCLTGNLNANGAYAAAANPTDIRQWDGTFSTYFAGRSDSIKNRVAAQPRFVPKRSKGISNSRLH